MPSASSELTTLPSTIDNSISTRVAILNAGREKGAWELTELKLFQMDISNGNLLTF